MLRNWLQTNTPKKRIVSDSAKKDKSSTVDVPTKIFASSSCEDQQQADEPHSKPQ